MCEEYKEYIFKKKKPENAHHPHSPEDPWPHAAAGTKSCHVSCLEAGSPWSEVPMKYPIMTSKQHSNLPSCFLLLFLLFSPTLLLSTCQPLSPWGCPSVTASKEKLLGLQAELVTATEQGLENSWAKKNPRIIGKDPQATAQCHHAHCSRPWRGTATALWALQDGDSSPSTPV